MNIERIHVNYCILLYVSDQKIFHKKCFYILIHLSKLLTFIKSFTIVLNKKKKKENIFFVVVIVTGFKLISNKLHSLKLKWSRFHKSRLEKLLFHM